MPKTFKGCLMFCTYLPFRIEAETSAEALKKIGEKTFKKLSAEEEKELLAHIQRIEKADKVIQVKKADKPCTANPKAISVKGKGA